MYNKKVIKSLGVLAVLITLALVYTFAQKNRSNDELTEKAENNEEKADVPGTPVDDDPWKEMEKLVQGYYGEKGISYKGLIKLIDDNEEIEKTIEEYSFEYNFLNGNFQYSLDSMEFVSQDKYILAIDHRSHVITLSASRKKQTASQLFDMEEFKKIMLEQKANAIVTQSGNEKMLTIDHIKHPQIQGYRIHYDPQTYKISKMLIGVLRLSPLSDEGENYIDESPVQNEKDAVDEEEKKDEGNDDEEIDTYNYYVEIIYRESKILNNEKEFDPMQKFLIIRKDKIELKPAFAEYELLHMSAQTEQLNHQPDDDE